MLARRISRKTTVDRLTANVSRNLSSRLIHALATLARAFSTVTGAWARSEKVNHSFLGGPDGNTPFAGVIFVNGNIHGKTAYGGKYLAGTVYELMPTRTAWKERVLHRFTAGSDGGYPYGELVADGSGNLYGTTQRGGTWAYATNRYQGQKHSGPDALRMGRLSVYVVTDPTYVRSTLTGYAYETIANKPIIAGEEHGTDDSSMSNPQPATLGHLARGADVTVRRHKK